ncbi:MAG: hypothetical protein ACE37K_04850 [Planctomycetota bacterium]
MHGGLEPANRAGPALRRFAAGLRWRHVCGRGVGAALRWGLLFALPAVLVAWLWPAMAWSVARVCVLGLLPIVLVATVRAWWHSRGVLTAMRASMREAGIDAAMLNDELLTWLEFDRVAAQATGVAAVGDRRGMLRWLESDVHARLQPHRKVALRAVSRPQLGRWRWLLPALLLLLLAWLLSLWIQPPWRGAVGGRPDTPESGDANGEGGGGSGAVPQPGGADGSGGEDAQDPPDGAAPPQPVPVGPDGKEPDPSEPDEVPPLVDRPDDQRFVLPDYIGDGPTRRERMHAAELEQPAPGGAPQTRPQGGAGDRPEVPRPTDVRFDRAAEKALRSRHVPEHERAIVRRFFDELQKRGGK